MIFEEKTRDCNAKGAEGIEIPARPLRQQESFFTKKHTEKEPRKAFYRLFAL
jgi:hypothetical protein